MTNAADRLHVHGVAAFHTNHDGKLTAGEIHLRGNVSGGGLMATGSQRTILSGTSIQTINVGGTTATGARFRQLDIQNAAGVTFINHTYISGSLDLDGEMTINTNLTVRVIQDLTLRDGSVLNNSGTLTYGGTLTDEGATINGNAPTSS